MYTVEDMKAEIKFCGASHKYRADKHFKCTGRVHCGFIFYLRGSHRFDFKDGVFKTQKGDFIFLPKDAHYINSVVGSEIEYLQIDFRILKNGVPVNLFDTPKKLKSEYVSTAKSCIRDACECYVDRGRESALCLIGYIAMIVDLFLQSEKQQNKNPPEFERIADSVRYIKSNFTGDFSVAELAAMSSTCVSNFEKLFRKCFGMGAVAYRNTLRIEAAKHLLAGGHSVAEAGAAVGFSDAFYFSKMFKKHVGASPGEYKKRYRGV